MTGKILLISSLIMAMTIHASASDIEDTQREASVTCREYNDALSIEKGIHDDVNAKQVTPAFYNDMRQVDDIINSYKERDVWGRDKGIDMNTVYINLEKDCEKSENLSTHTYDVIFSHMHDYIPSVN